MLTLPELPGSDGLEWGWERLPGVEMEWWEGRASSRVSGIYELAIITALALNNTYWLTY